MSGLAPPGQKHHAKEDPGAHELAESSDEHFSDASEGQGNRSRSGTASSPVPVTRVERVDDEPRYGEVPGTSAYNLRAQDAVPDEIEVVPEGMRSRSASRLSESDRPLTPGGTMIPKTVVEKVEPENPSYGEVPGTEAWEKRRADAEPDEVLMSPTKTRLNLEGEPTEHRSDSRRLSDQSRGEEVEHDIDRPPDAGDDRGDDAEDEAEDDGFGDDFDDFEEGEHVDGDDFGDFGDAEDATPVPTPRNDPPALIDPLADLPSLDFLSLHTTKDIHEAISPYLQEMFPGLRDELPTPTDIGQPEPLLTDRSSALWSQLVAPPPLQPPNWIKSRIRRLFLVSLGVPVDLDEILPASKQKKLILPSIHLNGESPRPSGQLTRTIQGNASTTSVATTDSKTGEPKRERRKKGPPERAGPPPPPKFDTSAASLISKTTEAALQSLTDDELKGHVGRLETIVAEANQVLEYWLHRKDSALGDKEAFEGVIENLVGFVAKSKASKSKR
ncbi:Peptidyl-prolyl cis-trans isomerase-like 4 [Sphaceloma murrayae]|uniref:Peptidyl-prolyl cis-trans isomerase-like 4 n=1 Tax=Sphaceloma murrayae TaxID=2082308 RepID=A0A2K1R2S8_9PEZI|nr:Peptidyl-prolyl cis-trans isomerase-like 4 [Sphaceloma murrayae]